MIFITGPHCSGKTHALRNVYEYGFPSIDLGPTLRKLYQDFSFGLTFPQWLVTGEESYGDSFTDRLIVLAIEEWIEKQLAKHEGKIQDFIISGNRSVGGIQYIVDHFDIVGEPTVIYVDADPEVLRSRYQQREGVIVSPEDFEAYLDRDYRMGLASVRRFATHLISNGDTTDDNLRRKMDAILFDELGHKKESVLDPKEGRISLENECRFAMNKERK